jgi:hypothetical protein
VIPNVTATGWLRSEVVRKMQRKDLGYRMAARDSGVDHAVLYRFLHGRQILSDTFDALARWIALP